MFPVALACLALSALSFVACGRFLAADAHEAWRAAGFGLLLAGVAALLIWERFHEARRKAREAERRADKLSQVLNEQIERQERRRAAIESAANVLLFPSADRDEQHEAAMGVRPASWRGHRGACS